MDATAPRSSSRRDAFAHDFIVGLPKGYDTMSANAAPCSPAAEAARRPCPRFLRNAPILILDEARRRSISDSEAAIQAASRSSSPPRRADHRPSLQHDP